MKKQSLMTGAVIAATLTSGMAFAELSANMGVVSAYYFRGVQQSGAAGQGGVDYDFGNGAAIGVWASDVGGHAGNNGIEYDIYGSYGGEAGDISYSVGYTLYQYTGKFDSSYGEVNLGAGVGPVAIDVAIGSHEGGGWNTGAPDNDYTFVSLSGDIGPVAATYGTWSGDYTGAYLELGISTDIGGAEAGLSMINSDADATDPKNFVTDGTALVFSLTKGFEL